MLTDRQMLILQAIIDHYTQYDEPVGSKTLSANTAINASSATIRNEMAKLEMLHFISKTHSSSGRVPAEAGYRYYVNYIMPKFGGLIDYGLTEEEQAMVKEIFTDPYVELEEVITQSVETLAQLSENIVIALGPSALNQRLAQFQVVPLSADKGMAILVTDMGTVENQVFTLSKGFSWQVLENFVKVMNSDLIHLPLPQVIKQLRTTYLELSPDEDKQMSTSLVERLVNKIDGERVIISGHQLLYHHLSEAEDFKQINILNHVLDNQQLLIDLMSELDSGIQIKIGNELAHPNLKNMSLMTANIGGSKQTQQLTFALLGPENMPYLKMAQYIHGIRKELNKFMGEYQNNN